MRPIRTLSLLTALAGATMALAQPVSYATKTVNIRAGVLIADSQAAAGIGNFNPAPHVWSLFGADNLVKPADWVVDSPSAMRRLTESGATRWGFLASNIGDSLNKNSAAYWEVILSQSTSASLSEFDILSLSVRTRLVMSPAERENLRRYIDQGGILWIDIAPSGTFPVIDATQSSPVPFVLQNDGAVPAVDVFHPALTRPNRITQSEFNSTVFPTNAARSFRRLTPADLGGSLQTLLLGSANESRFDPVSLTSNGATMGVAQIGDGYLVVTSRGVQSTFTRTTNGAGLVVENNGFFAGAAVKDRGYVASAKLITNLLSLSARFSGKGAGSRNSNSLSTTLRAPLLKKFIAGPSGLTKGTPALFNGRTVIRLGDRLYVYDSESNRDLDRDGNPDDGVVDPVGSPFDLLWISQSMTDISDPVVIEVSGAARAEQVWVVGTDSVARGYDLNAAGAADPLNVVPFSTINPPANTATNPTPFTPTYHEGVLYVTDFRGTLGSTQGRIWAINPRRADAGDGNQSKDVDDNGPGAGNFEWVVGGSNRFRTPGASATIGYIPIQDSSEGSDRVAYIGTSRTGADNFAPQLVSIWLGARGEVPTNVQLAGPALNITTRAALQALPLSLAQGDDAPFGLRLQVLINDAGNVRLLSEAEMQSYFTNVVLQPSNGQLSFTLSGAGTGSGIDWDGTATPVTTDDASFRLDYTIDWTVGAAGADNYIRGFITVVDTATAELRLAAAPALNENGNVGFIVRSNTGGTFYNFSEQGRGSFFVKSRFEFHNALTSLGLSGATVGYPTSVIDNDELVRLLPFLNSPMRNIQPVGIASKGDTFYVTASGLKALGPVTSPTSVLIAFNANPNPLEFQIETGGQTDNNFVLRQPDPARSGNKAAPEVSSSVPANAFTVEPVPNTTRARISMRSLSNSTRDNLGACLANNLPVIIVRNGQTETLVEPEAPSNNGRFIAGRSSGRWNHVRWYTVMNGYDVQVSPVVTGSTMFVAGRSLLPSILATGVPGAFDGLVFGLDSAISPDDSHLFSTPGRPWVSQLWTLRYAPNPGNATPFNFDQMEPATVVRWPQFKGVQSFDDLRIRILQATLGDSSVSGLAAGDGSLAVTGDSFLSTFGRSDFMVVDSGRVSRFDPSGNPLWSTEATFLSGPGADRTTAETPRPLSEPSRVYPDGDSGYVMVDPGNDAVLRVDSAGREVRTIRSIRMHADAFGRVDATRPENSPRGAQSGAPLLLRQPRDVRFWTTSVSAADVQRLFPSEGSYRTYRNERWDHWLIADSGNSRVIEVIDRYELDSSNRVIGLVRYRDPAGDEGDGLAPAQGILWWHTPEEFTSTRYSFNSIDRTSLELPSGAVRTVFAMGFGNVQPSARTFGLDNNPAPAGGPGQDAASGYGGVLLYDGPDTKIIREIIVPNLIGNIFLTQVGAGNPFTFSSSPREERRIGLSGLRSVTVKYVSGPSGAPVLTAMLSLDSGVYEVWQDPATPADLRWKVRWMLPREAYATLRIRDLGAAASYSLADLDGNPLQFQPMHARRLESGDVLIVNGYTGQKRTRNGATPTLSEFNGEVLIVDGRFVGAGAGNLEPGFNLNRPNLGFNALSVLFELPPVQGIRGLVRPVFAERQ